MNNDYLIQLTKNLYGLTILFPKKEPLRYKIRELADDILSDAVFFSEEDFNILKDSQIEKVIKNLEILDSFFEIAKSQNWVSPEELLNTQAEYAKIQDQAVKISYEKKSEKISPKSEVAEDSPSKDITSRQEKILEVIKEKQRAQVWEIKKVFPDVTKRTLRRDFEQLLKKNIVERIGEKNNTFYVLRQNNPSN